MGNVIDNQCPNCGARIHFNPKLGKFKCDYCDSVLTEEELNKGKKREEVSTTDKEENINFISYNCPDCGAEIIADEQTAATFCIYCGNVAILKNKLSGTFKPDKLIPFKKEKQDAINAFKQISKGRPLTPKTFNDEKNIEKIRGLYVPFWLYEIKTSGTICAEGINRRSWTSGDRRYTKTDYYSLTRGGECTYERIPADASTRFNDEIMNTIEPYDYNDLIDYKHVYLAGFLAEKYDIEKEKMYETAKQRALNSVEELFLSDMGHYDTKTVKSNDLKSELVKTEYALLPVWMVNVKFNGKFYLFAMNGQTGEFIGDIPIDKKKLLIWCLATFAITFIIVVIFSYIIHISGGAV